MTEALTLSKDRAACTSTWTAWWRMDGVIGYSDPTWDYDNIYLSVPDSLSGATFNGVKINYSVSSISGSKFLRFYDTREDVSDSSLLRRLQSGDTYISLLFGFKAVASGTVGSYSATCNWQNISVTVECTLSGGAYRIDSSWNNCTVWYNDNGTWKQCNVYYNDNGTWKQVR